MKLLTVCFAAILAFLTIVHFSPRIPGPARERGAAGEERERTGALEALEFWTRARAYPDPDIAPDKFYTAYLQSKRLGKESERGLQTVSAWQSIGPVNLQGRTISIAINPLNGNTVYLGSASGGLWRSRTGGLGNDWQRVLTGYPVLGVGAIAIDPHDTNTIFIGTGEVYRDQGALGGLVIRTTRGSYGIGILKSTDGGASWSKSLDWSMNQERGVQAIRINPLNTKTIFAATTLGFYKSPDGGATWNSTLALPMAEDILINGADTSRLLATFGNFDSPGAGLFSSTDAGENWSSVGSFPLFSGKALLEGYPPNPGTVFASVADSTTSVSSLWSSGNFGASWSQISSQDVAGVQGWYSHFVAVKPDDSSRVVRAGVSIYYSTDGGFTLSGSAGSYSDHHAYAHHPSNPNILYVVNDDGVYRSTNFGVSFTNVGFGMQTGQFYNGFSNSASDSLLAIGQVQDHIPGYRYTGSLSWGRTALDECGWTAVNQQNDATMFAVDRNGGDVGRSVNRGLSFSYVASFPASGSWNSPLILAPSDTNVLYLGLDRVYKSTNRGSSWVATSTSGFLDGNLVLAMAVSATNADTVYVTKAPLGARSHLYRTATGGTAWTDITGTLPDRYPLDLAVDPHNSRIVYAAFGGANAGHLFRSSNSGQSWTDVTGTLPDVPATAVLVDPANSNVVYAGNDIGVYVSTDAGGSWNLFSDGLPDAVLISDLSISSSNRMLRAATHGNGLYERRMPGAFPSLTLLSPNGGEEWPVGSVQTIAWSEAAVPALRLEYSTDDGASWVAIADSVPAASGSYLWHVPYPPAAQARVRISSHGGTAIADTSDAPFSITFHGTALRLDAGWNMISLPVVVADPQVSTLFPDASSPAFEYDESYQPRTALVNGTGYWLRYPSQEVVPVSGDSIAADTLTLVPGWNLIGSVSGPLLAADIASDPPGSVVSRYFGYASGYHPSDTLFPGSGYWVKSLDTARLFLGTSPKKRGAAGVGTGSLNTLTITDAAGTGEKLFFGFADGAPDAALYEMPPVAPGEGLDARFASGRMIGLIERGRTSRAGILLSHGTYPLTVRWSVRSGTGTLFVDGRELALRGEGTAAIAQAPARLEVGMTTAPALPASFSLAQNYPNPFNPATELGYEIPAGGRVVLKVYDLIGREVATLVDAVQPAGSYRVRWDAGTEPSGIYFYTISAGSFRATRAMSLIR